MLYTLGGLRLEGSNFGREKPLLLLAYLALEGPKPRRFLAELFWPEAADPMNSLAVALSKLRKLGAIYGDESRAWVDLDCDALDLQDALRSGRWEEGLRLYRGPFAEGLKEALGAELEEWVLEVCERLALEVRLAHLVLAERAAAQADFAEAAAQAEQAYRVAGAPPLEPEGLPKLHRLLLAAAHPLAETLEREARELGLSLSRSTPSRNPAQPGLVGREQELQSLLNTPEGAWVWVKGGAGLGKSALLRELEVRTGWLYLPARSGLPYATLEPLLESVQGGEETLLRRLASLGENLMVDGWEQIDPESQRLLTRLRNLRPPGRVLLAGQGEPPFGVEVLLELKPLGPGELSAFPGAYEATGGLPALVAAWLRGEPLEAALETRLLALGEEARQVYMALALLENPDLLLARNAAGLSATAMAQAVDELLSAGLIDLNGAVYGREAALRFVAERPAQEARLSLGLARQLRPQQALPFFRRARALIEEADLPHLLQAYAAWATELIRRGFPRRAAEELAEAPQHPELSLLRARALERAGLYREALEVMRFLPDTPEHLALKATLFHRSGRADEAQQAAEKALSGGIEARAEAHNTLGLIYLARGQLAEASAAFRRAAALWLGLGDESRRLGALGNLAIVRARQGQDAAEAFAEVLEAAQDNPQVQAQALINLGKEHERKRNLAQALQSFLQAEQVALASGNLKQLALALNNAGAVQHTLGQTDAARTFYQRAVAAAREAGEAYVLALALSNLAELEGDLEVWQEAIAVSENAGYSDLAQQQREQLRVFMERSG
ncbi:SARP family transcriptional regulator [Meiothermus hypogaeus]|uniref:SARP family transcriptional regulator n=2 Tax=Meiothermus hypogaeus TaxID=884155 RepID=A0A511R1R6_9DEIN|nr:SARP family transcriptional regulator [Meiothermus hypogaeus]RIH78724.1 Tetratricopeptide repeat protein [Meiothermus hypogaeus]GEM83247.1 SARP family transcriptional regulator [Meiothermus hypogaeus NBRC 106114]